MPEIMFGLACMLGLKIKDQFSSFKSAVFGFSALFGSYIVYRRMIPYESNQKKKGRYVYIGTFTEEGPSYVLGDQLGQGVYTFWLGDDGSLTQVGEPVKCKNPTFLCSSPDGKYLYAGNEVGNFNMQENGSITSYKIDKKNGTLKMINQVSSGKYVCHVDMNSRGDRLVSACYMD